MQDVRSRMSRMTGKSMDTEEAKDLVQQFERVPSSTFYFGLLGSILLSLWLFMAGRRWESLFVGLWAPTIMSFGLFSKLLKPMHREL